MRTASRVIILRVAALGAGCLIAIPVAANKSRFDTKANGQTQSVEVTHNPPSGGNQPPSAPGGLFIAGKSGNSLTLQWSAATPGPGRSVDHYEIWRNGAKIGETSSLVATVTYAPTGNSWEFFSVLAVDDKGRASALSSEVLAPHPNAANSTGGFGTEARQASVSGRKQGFTSLVPVAAAKYYLKGEYQDNYSRIGRYEAAPINIVQEFSLAMTYDPGTEKWSYSASGSYVDAVAGVSATWAMGAPPNDSVAELRTASGQRLSTFSLDPTRPRAAISSPTSASETEISLDIDQDNYDPFWDSTYHYNRQQKLTISGEFENSALTSAVEEHYAGISGQLDGIPWNTQITYTNGQIYGPFEPGDGGVSAFGERAEEYNGQNLVSLALTGSQYRGHVSGGQKLRWAEVFTPADGGPAQVVGTHELSIDANAGDTVIGPFTIDPPGTAGTVQLQALGYRADASPSLSGPRSYAVDTLPIRGTLELSYGTDLPTDAFGSVRAIVSYPADKIRLIAIDPGVEQSQGLDYALAHGYTVSPGADLYNDPNWPGVGGWKLLALGLAPGEGVIEVKFISQYENFTATRTVHVVAAPELAVDANSDGQIKFAGEDVSDVTSTEKPYRFWLNDDDDGDSDGAEDVKNSSTIDYDRTSIKNTRDLEDFARIWIDASGIATALKNGDLQLALRWSDVTGTPKIKLFKAYESDGGTQYLKDAPTAASQIAGEFGQPITSVAGAVAVSPSQTFVLKKEVFASLTDTQSKAFFLFEGAGIGKGQLKLVLIDRNGGETEGGSVWLYLTNIKAMYERAVASIGFNEPWNYAHTSDLPAFTASVTVDPQDWAFQQPTDETKESLIFVHGWKMDAEDTRIFSETMFKRLWWQGYKGRFRVFRWPTYTGDYSFSDSEFVAWKCGAALKSYVEGSVPGASLPSDYTRCVAAHSLGNVVVGSALKQGLNPTRYLLLHAAIPSGCYDTSDAVNGFANPSSASSAFNAVPSMAVFGSMFSGGEGSQPTPDNAAPDWGYRGFLTGVTGGQFVNFCNPEDFALTTGNTVGIDTNWLAWQFGYKPRNRVIDSPEINYAYRYLSSAPSGQRLKLYRYYDSSHDTITAERFAADAHESMAFLARTRSLPIGADLQAGGSITSTVNLNADYGFGRSRADHSGEFRRPIQTVSEVYGRIREALR